MAQGSNPPALTHGPASDFTPRRARWCWADRVPTNALTLLAGREGIGKSTVWVALAAKLSTGLLPGEHLGTPTRTLVVATEDDWEHTIAPRLLAAGADLKMIEWVQPIELPGDLPSLVMLLGVLKPSLVVLDPLTSRLDGKLDTHKDSDTRRALEALVEVCQRMAVSCIGLIHVNKSNAAEPLDTLMGSRAFPAVARSVLFVFADAEREGVRHLAHAKCNVAGRAPTMEFTIMEVEVGQDDGPITAGAVVWGAETETTAYDLNAEQAGSREEKAERSDCVVWLKAWLLDHGGESPAVDVVRAGMAQGFSRATVYRARKPAGAESTMRGRTSVWTVSA